MLRREKIGLHEHMRRYMREYEDEVESQRWNEVMGGNEEIRHAMRGWEGGEG